MNVSLAVRSMSERMVVHKSDVSCYFYAVVGYNGTETVMDIRAKRQEACVLPRSQFGDTSGNAHVSPIARLKTLCQVNQ